MAVITDGQLFISETGEALDGATDLVEIQRGTSVFTAAGTVENFQRPLVRSYIDRQAPGAGLTRYWTTAFTTELRGTSATPSVSVLPEVHQLLQASGLTASFADATHSYIWTDQPNASPYSVTTRFEESTSGNYYVSADSNYTFTISGSADNLATIAWSGVGEWATPTAMGSETEATAIGGTPMIAVSAYSLFGQSSGLVIRDYSITGGLEITPRLDVAGGDGYAWPGTISRPAPTSITLTVEAVQENTVTAWADWISATVADVDLTLTAGARSIALKLNNVSFNAPVLQQGTPNMFALTGQASTAATGTPSSLTLEFT
mgnify:CR=1 FL=1